MSTGKRGREEEKETEKEKEEGSILTINRRESVCERVRVNLSYNQQRGRSKGGRAIESEKGGEVEDAF
jgi:hypothetical protein